MSQRIEKALQCFLEELKPLLAGNSPVLGEACCVTVDGVQTWAKPLRLYDAETETLSDTVTWVNPDDLAPIRGNVVAADPCDCPCLDCPTP